MSGGWIKLHRSLRDWDWAKKPNTFCLFVHLLLNANHEKGSWQGVEILPGQIITGRESLSRQTGLTERAIRTSLNHLKTTNEVTIKTTSKYSIITITNWKKYQSCDQQNANERPANDQQTTTNKKDNNNKKDKKEDIAVDGGYDPKEDKDNPLYNPAWFNGKVIKLRKNDYFKWLEMTGWSETYFDKILSERDDWLADNPAKSSNWFISTSKFLQKSAQS